MLIAQKKKSENIAEYIEVVNREMADYSSSIFVSEFSTLFSI